jgi:3-oxoacyl-[acyl-carrier-protein] synthase III
MCSPETVVLEDVGDNNLRGKDHLRMDGSAVLNSVQMEVPPRIESLLALAGTSMEDVDWFLCQQPNRFMLQELADKMKVPYAKMPMNVVVHFGNSSGVTIPGRIVEIGPASANSKRTYRAQWRPTCF